ncbi:MAG: hypothetical protein ACT4OM_10020 [Actinomycetota bacterium]
MADSKERIERLARISANLTPTGERPESAIQRLETLLVRSRVPGESKDLLGFELSVERADWHGVGDLEPETIRRLEQISGVAAEPAPQFRVFRREAPLAASMLELATPEWGRGVAKAESLGPFLDNNGRAFWFDFYPIIKLISVYLAGDPQPALLLELQANVLKKLGQVQITRIIGKKYTLGPGSIWIRADLLAPGAPAGHYVGLTIGGGELQFTPAPQASRDSLVITAGGELGVRLNLKAPSPPPASGGEAGRDAAESQINLPSDFHFTLKDGSVRVTHVDDAGWVLYGEAVDFGRQGGEAVTYEPSIRSLLIGMNTAQDLLRVGQVASHLAQPSGVALIGKSGWALPTAAIDTTDPSPAEGIGGLAVQTFPGTDLTWRGLEDGPVRLPSPWVMLWPGSIFILDDDASNLFAHQEFRLWKDEDSRFRSELELRYTDSFALFYSSNSQGTEMVMSRAKVEARIDRPVDVRGDPLSVRTTDSQLILTYSDDQQGVSIYDDNILADAMKAGTTWPEVPGAVSLAIRNALFITTPANSLLLFATLADERTVEKGALVLGFGLYGLLPTLPDPYAANVGALRRVGVKGSQVSQLLAATTKWEKAPVDEAPDSVKVDFAFAPIGKQRRAFAGLQGTGTTSIARDAPAGGTGESFAVRMAASNQPNPSDDWDRHFRAFERDQFALLDVSSNADQLGVSFSWFSRVSIDERESMFAQIFGKDEGEQAGFPLQVQDLDLSAEIRFVRAFTVPQISWEPLFNLPGPQPPTFGDPPIGHNLYPNDGGPTRILNDGKELVPIAPIPVAEFLVHDFEVRKEGFTGALFTLPFGLRAFAEFSRKNQFQSKLPAAKLGFNRPEYEGGDLIGGLQIRAEAPKHPAESPIFKGSTLQLNNVLNAAGLPTGAGTLGDSVGTIFNKEFFYDGNTGYKDRGVPLTRIDFSGYGASIFSHWLNPNAAIAATSQSFFDAFVGRTAHEVIQVRSILYPWAVKVVRTITIFRTSSAHVFRFDTGWQAESDGRYDFRYYAYNAAFVPVEQPNPYEIHPGIVRGVTKVRNIIETDAVPNFKTTWNKSNGDLYVDDNGKIQTVDATTPANERSPEVDLQPAYFDADVIIDDVKSGATDGRVPSRGMLGYIQLVPRGEPISQELFAALLNTQGGSLGGPVDCVIDVAGSGQLMRVSRADVSPSESLAGKPIFVSAGRGAVVLPKEGSWSVVVHSQGSGEVAPLDGKATVPVVRRGKLQPNGSTDAIQSDLLRIANPADLVKPLGAGSKTYGLLQSTGTQKALFRLPSFEKGVKELKGGVPPEFADAYRIVNSVGIFPNVNDALPLVLGNFKTKILEEGYKLLDELDPGKVFEQLLPEGPLYLINEEFLKIYVEYADKDRAGATQGPGKVRYGFDSAAADVGKKWLAKVNDIGMVVDLGPLKRLMMIKGKFDAEKGRSPGFIEPELVFSDELKPVIDLLQILSELQGGDYKAAFAKGLEIAMSNSADSWNYAFHARKEIPVVKFPPGTLYDNPTNPFKLEAHLAVGVYFNESLSPTTDPKQLVPSAGAFLEFGGRISVMCCSVAAATVYATGAVDLRTSADIKTGPALYMKFGFGAEVTVGLPVVGNVSVLFMVGVEIDLDSTQITVSGFLLFRGRAELLGGIVSVTITIEAKGSVKKSGGKTDMIAQVTFGLDISIFLVINISFSESWQEQRQIA